MIRMPVFTLFIFTGISGLFAGGDNKLPPLKHEASWADGLVWYQIFPERFRNGDLSDDPGPSEIPETGGFPGLFQPLPVPCRIRTEIIIHMMKGGRIVLM